MRIFLGLAAIIAVGCGPGQPAETKADSLPTTARISVSGPAKVEPPNFEQRTALRMIRNGDEARVGDPVESALRAFREEKNSYLINEMPAGWKDPAYTCRGWDNGTIGFSAFVYDDKMVLGLYHEDRADEKRLQEIVADYDRAIPSGKIPPITGSRVRYWFWEQGTHRLMICATQIPQEGLSIAISLGENRIMDILRMNPLMADRDRQVAEKLFQEGLKARQGS
jgi:hypothetical protein